MMKILLKILVAPFALALSLLAALLVFLLDICAFLLTIASVILAVLGIALAGYRPLFHADPHRRDCISVPRLPPFAVWAASGGVLSALGTGRRKIRSVSISDKLTSGQHGPKQERVA